MVDDAVEELLDPPLSGQSHRRVHGVDVDLIMGRALVKQAQRVAHAALGKSRDQFGRLMGDGKMFGVRHMLDIGGELRRVDAAEAVALAAREDRRGDLLQLGRREDKDQMLRRLLDDLQKRVEGRG